MTCDLSLFFDVTAVCVRGVRVAFVVAGCSFVVISVGSVCMLELV